MTNRLYTRSALVAAFSISAMVLSAQPLALSGLFSDHMVIQRDKPVVVTGKASPGETVSVSFGESQGGATADAEGRWEVRLPARKAGGPFEITVKSGDESITLNDVLVGDVWVCSGQSNMNFALHRTDGARKAIREATNPNLRLYTVPRTKSIVPLVDLEKPGQWDLTSPESARGFSAVGYYFGEQLQRELNVPIGLIHTSWGGTRAEWWTPMEGVTKFAYIREDLESVKAGLTDGNLEAKYWAEEARWRPKFRAADPGHESKGNWADPALDISSWESVVLPMKLEEGYFADANGSAWYRRTFTLTDEQASQPFKLSITCMDDMVEAFINGVRVGESDVALEPQIYAIESELLKAGENVVAIQVLDYFLDGGLCGDIALVADDITTISLNGEWKFRPGLKMKDGPEHPARPPKFRPTLLYNAMIAPLQKFPIRGATWYQGEANAKSKVMAEQYAEVFSTMITQWRKGWGQGDFPFLYVQLAGFKPKPPPSGESLWSIMREEQADTLKIVPHTAMASALDVGDNDDIHPTNKRTVGERLAQAALALEYGRDVVGMGPLYESHEIQGDKAVIRFTHGTGLKTPEGEPVKGFTIAGADGNFVPASAVIIDDTVVISSDQVRGPVAVRYNWHDTWIGNLYNQADLPASPFRTDRP